MADAPVVLRASGIRKAYGQTQALGSVDIEVRAGQIRALIGGNGSGKSTLIKILAGVEPADDGRVELSGVSYDARELSPEVARRGGLHVVHQHSSTFGSMDLTDNLALGRGYDCQRLAPIPWRRTRARTTAVLERFGIDARPGDRLDSLRPAAQTMVAIARALQDQDGRHDGVLILDEPTAALPAAEVHHLFDALRRYSAAGQAIVFVTHRLHEVLDLAHDVTVLRDGRLVASVPRADVGHDELVELIAGRSIVAEERTARIAGEPVLVVDGLAGGAVRDATFSLNAGETVGVAGLLGSGRTSLLQLLFGALPRESGRMHLCGRELDVRTPRDAMRAGIAYVPENRTEDAAFATLTVRENLNIALLGRYWRRGRLDSRAEAGDSTIAIGDFQIRVRSDRQALSDLSGGNQQKVIMARWLRRQPQVLLLDEPSQGVDVGARAEIHHMIRAATDQGACALVVSSDLDELAAFCDRAIVLSRGRVIAELDGDALAGDRLERAVLAEAVAA